MSKQSQSPPRGDKPTPTAPPPPPAWRHWLWPLGLLAAVVLFLFLPRVSGVPSVILTYSQFLSDVNAHKVKTFTLDNSTGSTAPGTGTLAMSPRSGMVARPSARIRAGSDPEPARPTPRRASGAPPGAQTMASMSPPRPQRCGPTTAMAAAVATAASAPEPPWASTVMPADTAS